MSEEYTLILSEFCLRRICEEPEIVIAGRQISTSRCDHPYGLSGLEARVGLVTRVKRVVNGALSKKSFSDALLSFRGSNYKID